jgi:hypothetical protein
MLPDSVKAGLKEVASKVASGKMKPGDSMVIADDDQGMEDKEGMSGMFKSLASDMMTAFENKDTDGLAELLEELCEHSKY